MTAVGAGEGSTTGAGAGGVDGLYGKGLFRAALLASLALFTPLALAFAAHVDKHTTVKIIPKVRTQGKTKYPQNGKVNDHGLEYFALKKKADPEAFGFAITIRFSSPALNETDRESVLSKVPLFSYVLANPFLTKTDTSN